MNDELGENVELYINRVARPHEVAKFRLHVEEVGKITSLLLSLSGRLARAENALMGMTDDHAERVSNIIKKPYKTSIKSCFTHVAIKFDICCIGY